MPKSRTIELTAADGHRLAAHRADPDGAPKGGIVVVQEIFGLNSHVRSVCDGFAADGWLAVAPALFDRKERGLELGYAPDDIPRGRDVAYAIPFDDALKDIDAALALVRAEAGSGAVVGYCWGGTLAWLSATRLSPDAAVGYYGGGVAKHAGETPRCPTMLHFGETDHAIPLSDVEAVKAAHPGVPVHLYPAGHGFNCDQRGSYDAASARAARERTLAFLAANAAAGR